MIYNYKSVLHFCTVTYTEYGDDIITFCQCLRLLHLASQRVHRATDCAHGMATDALHDGVAVPELVRWVVSTTVTSYMVYQVNATASNDSLERKLYPSCNTFSHHGHR